MPPGFTDCLAMLVQSGALSRAGTEGPADTRGPLFQMARAGSAPTSRNKLVHKHGAQLQPFSCPERAPPAAYVQVPSWPLQSQGTSVGCLDSSRSWGSRCLNFNPGHMPTLLAGKFREIVSSS